MIAMEPMARMLLMDAVDSTVHIQEGTEWMEEMLDLRHLVPEEFI